MISRVVRWIVLPQPGTPSSDVLLARNVSWDLLLILPSSEHSLPTQVLPHVKARWTITAGIPSRILGDFSTKNASLLYPRREAVLPVDPGLQQKQEKLKLKTTEQNLELTSSLWRWVQEFKKGDGGKPVSMLNLMAFKEGMLDNYIEYGKEFAKRVGSRHGGNAKITGIVINDGEGLGISRENGQEEKKKQWDQIALATYPTIEHFAAMLTAQDYQEVNHRYRLPALKDTFILCTTELGLPTTTTETTAKL